MYRRGTGETDDKICNLKINFSSRAAKLSGFHKKFYTNVTHGCNFWHKSFDSFRLSFL